MIALSAVGFGLSILGNRRSSQPPVVPSEEAPESTSVESPFVLTLSSDASRIRIESIGKIHDIDPSSRTISGSLPIELGHPSLFIDIEWKDQSPSPRFAKLVLEPAGFPTMTRIFDTAGNLSDVWELHLHE